MKRVLILTVLTVLTAFEGCTSGAHLTLVGTMRQSVEGHKGEGNLGLPGTVMLFGLYSVSLLPCEPQPFDGPRTCQKSDEFKACSFTPRQFAFLLQPVPNVLRPSLVFE